MKATYWKFREIIKHPFNIKPIFRNLILIINAVRLLPHICILVLGKRNENLFADIRRWTEICLPAEDAGRILLSFLKLMSHFPEFRNLYYYRVGLKGKIFSMLCPPMSTLYISTERIGPGLFIQHGFATIIAAKEIGANCWINQQVTIGFSNATDQPTLYDNVVVRAGAKIIGNVIVGKGSIVGANAVVVKNVPPNVTVVGVPAKIVRRNGQRVTESL